jgi:hypothetical protein
MNEIILRNMSEESKKNMTTLKHTGIELTSGVVAGIAAATLSQVISCPPVRVLTVACGHTFVSDQQGKRRRRRSYFALIFTRQGSWIAWIVCWIGAENGHDCTLLLQDFAHCRRSLCLDNLRFTRISRRCLGLLRL